MKRILVGADDSPTAGDALGWAADIAGRTGTELVAARSFVPNQMELAPEYDAELHRRQHDSSSRGAASCPVGRRRRACCSTAIPPRGCSLPLTTSKPTCSSWAVGARVGSCTCTSAAWPTT